jgi:N-acetylneuraminic acid mutarotase
MLGTNMGKNAVVMLVLAFLTASCLSVKPALSSAEVTENSWESKASMLQARSGLGAAVVDGKIYAIGGSTRSGEGSALTGGVVGTNEEYDLATDMWTYKRSMPTFREGVAIASYGGKIYCIGGYASSGGATAVNEVYDPIMDTWEPKASMPTARAALQANVMEGKIYLIGGYTPDNSAFGYSISNLVEVYDPATDTWTTKDPMPTAAANYVSAVVDKKLFIIGGESSVPQSNLNQIYDPNSDSWSIGAPSPSGIRYGACAAGATIGVNAPKRIYVLGEALSLWEGEPTNFVRVYNPDSDSWTFGTDVPTKRQDFGVAVVNDMIYAIGGYTSTYRYLEDLSYSIQITKYATNDQYTPFGYGTTPPVIDVASPVNQTYNASSVSLDFMLNKPAEWIGYSLDGRDNVTIHGNTTLDGLSNGSHNVTVYARDELNNTGVSATVTFTVDAPFPTALVAASTASATIIGVGLIVYFKKRKR